MHEPSCHWDYYKAESRFVPNQRETALLCNDFSHWLGANLESALYNVPRRVSWSLYMIFHNAKTLVDLINQFITVVVGWYRKTINFPYMKCRPANIICQNIAHITEVFIILWFIYVTALTLHVNQNVTKITFYGKRGVTNIMYWYRLKKSENFSSFV